MSHSSTKLPIGTKTLPLWLTIGPQEDGSYEVLKDPKVQEMLDVFIQRMPDYYELKYKKSLKMPLQTLIHGDFHGGNHMYGTDDNEGKVIALDYQMFGKGFVARFLQESNALEYLQDLNFSQNSFQSTF